MKLALQALLDLPVMYATCGACGAWVGGRDLSIRNATEKLAPNSLPACLIMKQLPNIRVLSDHCSNSN